MSDNSFLSALRSGWQIFREQGTRRAAREGLYYGYESMVRVLCKMSSRDARRFNVFERDWDFLLILDACRVDLLEEVTDEYSFVNDIETEWSAGSASAEWMENTFVDEYHDEIADTIYITGNPFSEAYLDEDDFAEVHDIWRNHWNEDVGTVMPRPLTDKAIERWRETSDRRIMVHYMQPHYPFVDASLPGKGLSADKWGDVNETNVWYQLRDGKISRDEVWEAYRDNLRFVLDDVSLLIESVNADTVVLTSDHGNSLGEGMIYGHPRKICTSAVREVPWVETTARQVRDYEPKTSAGNESDESVEERLSALGYK